MLTMRWEILSQDQPVPAFICCRGHFATHAQTARSGGNEVPVSGTVKDKLGAPYRRRFNYCFRQIEPRKQLRRQRSLYHSGRSQSHPHFLHINYVELSYPVNNTIVLDVVMEAKEGNQNEVVVVKAMVNQKRISLVGAQTSVNVAELKQPVANISTMLAGRIAGIVGTTYR